MKTKKIKKSPITCPHCGSTDIGEYLYGLPIMEKLEDEINSGEIILGGCCINEDSPKYYCYHCEKDFGIYYKRKKSKIDY